MRLDVSNLQSAVQQLETSIEYLRSELARRDTGLRNQFQSAIVHNYSVAYDITSKTVRRQLEQDALNPAEIRQLGFMALMRQAADAGLVSDATQWHGYRELRNRTSHTYDQDEAEEVVRYAPEFLAEAKQVTERLLERNRA